ncbi:hypothetical protein E2C01_072221 [Portunus trituberculatus]|uniref:Uncharacterized protein n=1 Tax=Portunus trituberculatus TaxID=210409 RepID=A0A5B7I759_PORTR|nr:hypothetical protein [Portunus trituberculatus]
MEEEEEEEEEETSAIPFVPILLSSLSYLSPCQSLSILPRRVALFILRGSASIESKPHSE